MNPVEKIKIMGQINKCSLEDLQNKAVINKKASSKMYYELFDGLEQELEKRLNQPKKSSTKMIGKLIYVLIMLTDDTMKYNEEIIFSKQLYEKTLKLKDLYQNNIDKKDEYELSMLDVLYSKLSNANIRYIDLESREKDNTCDSSEKIDEVELKLIHSKEKIRKLKDDIKELNSRIKELNEIVSLSYSEDDINKYKNKKIELENKIIDLNKKITELEFENSRLKRENKKNNTLMVELQKTHNNEIGELKSKLDVSLIKEKKYDSYINNKIIQEEIDETVLEFIVNDKQTIKDIHSVLKYTYPSITYFDIFASLNRLKAKYSIAQNSIIDYDKAYEIGSGSYDNYYINNISDTLDIIVISDMHINSDIDASLYNLNLIYEYANNNDIRIILNLGDFIDGHFIQYNSKLEQFKLNDELVNNVISKLPKDDRIINLLLGGNHDRLVMNQGINVIEKISNERMDYASLNYDHSMLRVGNSILGLHHINRRFDEDFIKNTSFDNSMVTNLLSKYYDRKNVQRKDIHVDLLGHFHVSKVSTLGSYVVVPSLNNDHIQNGAFRIRFYFDTTGKIIETILIPLVVENKVYSSSSFCYQKVK